MTNHTPTPWAYGALNLRYKYQVFHEHWNGDCQAVDFVCELDATGDVSKANAELIVRAVNSHQALCDALSAACDTLELKNAVAIHEGKPQALIDETRSHIAIYRQALNQAKL